MEIPQANEFEKVLDVPDLVYKGNDTDKKISKSLSFTDRQGRYYLKAAKLLGLIEGRGKYVLTETGKEFVGLTPGLRVKLACDLIESTSFFRRVESVLNSAPNNSLSKIELVDFLVREADITIVTARRRVSTIRYWLEWYCYYRPGRLEIIGDKIILKRHEFER